MLYLEILQLQWNIFLSFKITTLFYFLFFLICPRHLRNSSQFSILWKDSSIKMASPILLILPEDTYTFFFHSAFSNIAFFVLILYLICILFYFIISLLQQKEVLSVNHTLRNWLISKKLLFKGSFYLKDFLLFGEGIFLWLLLFHMTYINWNFLPSLPVFLNAGGGFNFFFFNSLFEYTSFGLLWLIELVILFLSYIIYTYFYGFSLSYKLQQDMIPLIYFFNVFFCLLLIKSYSFLTLILLAVTLTFSLILFIWFFRSYKDTLVAETTLKYLIFNSIGLSFIILGFWFFSFVCSYDVILLLKNNIFSDGFDFIFNKIAFLSSTRYLFLQSTLLFLIHLGSLCILLGILLKLGVGLLHWWVADVYEGSPLIVTWFLITVIKVVYFFLFLKIFTFLFYSLGSYEILIESKLVLLLGIASMIIGSLSAIRQHRIKRFLAFSSVATLGYVLMFFINFQSQLNAYIFNTNIVFAIAFILAYILTISIILSIIVHFSNKYKNIFKEFIDIYFYKNINLFLSIIFILCFFSLASIPPLLGFFVKFLIFFHLLLNKTYSIFLISVFILTSFLGTFYYIKIIKILFFEKMINNKKLNVVISNHYKIDLYYFNFLEKFPIYFMFFLFLTLSLNPDLYLKILGNFPLNSNLNKAVWITPNMYDEIYVKKTFFVLTEIKE